MNVGNGSAQNVTAKSGNYKADQGRKPLLEEQFAETEQDGVDGYDTGGPANDVVAEFVFDWFDAC
jgi:hypothetical protein